MLQQQFELPCGLAVCTIVCVLLACKFDLFLVDVELMFQKIWSTSKFLVDKHHLNRDANYQVLTSI